MAASDLPPAQEPTADETVAARPARVEAGGRRLRSEALLGGAREVLIEHFGEVYRLRLTAAGKLILTK